MADRKLSLNSNGSITDCLLSCLMTELGTGLKMDFLLKSAIVKLEPGPSDNLMSVPDEDTVSSGETFAALIDLLGGA